MRTPSIAPPFSPLQTASTHNCRSIPHHNSAPPLSCTIRLHAHLVVAAIPSFLYNISHTPRQISHALSCSSNGNAAATKETANNADLTSKIRKCSHRCGDLISCYRTTFEIGCHSQIWIYLHKLNQKISGEMNASMPKQALPYYILSYLFTSLATNNKCR